MISTEAQFYTIHRKWILSIFLVIPFALLLWSWDMFFNDQGLLPYFGPTSLSLPLYLLFFEMPHIIASFVGFADKEYITHYRKHLLVGVPFMLACFFGLLWIDFTTAVAVYLAVTMYHVMRQQTGISLFFGVPKNRWFQVWSWSLTASIAVMYVGVMLPKFVEGLEASHLFAFIMSTFLLAIVSGVALMFRSSRIGILYILLTLAMVATSYLVLWFGYFFLAVFVGRFVHDVTAFLFYITHEMNRNVGQVKTCFTHCSLSYPARLLSLFQPLLSCLDCCSAKGSQMKGSYSLSSCFLRSLTIIWKASCGSVIVCTDIM